MPITFSSFGDVATVLQLAWQLRAALSDASRASAEIRALIIDVDSFTRALQQTKAAVEKRRTPLAPAIENGIKHAIIACYDALRLILRKIDAFKARVTTRVSAAAWRQYWAIAAWSILGGKNHVDALRGRLSEQIGVVQTYLSLAQSNDHAKIQETVDSQGVTLDRMYGVMQDIQLRFDVGVPSFHFYDEGDGCYTPFARTSFQRLREQISTMTCGVRGLRFKLDEAANRLNDASCRYAILSPIVLSGWVSFKHRSVPKWHPDPYHAQMYWIQVCIFRERAFDEWQVLLGSRYAGQFQDIEVLKLLVERSHPIGSRCHCKVGPCRNRLEACVRGLKNRSLLNCARILINQIEHLAMHWDDVHATAHRVACSILDNTILQTDRDLVQSSILPLLKLHAECQRPSLSKIEMTCKTKLGFGTRWPRNTPNAPMLFAHILSPNHLGRVSVVEYTLPSHLLEWL